MKSFSLLALPALLLPSSLSIVRANPVVLHHSRRSLQADTPAVDTQLLEHFNVYAQFSAAAYCQENLFPTEKFNQIACTQFGGRCPFVEKRDPQTVGGFIENSTYQAGGFLAHDHSERKHVLAFRGIAPVEKLQRMAEELAACPSVCAACRCRKDIYISWLSLKPQVLSLLHQARKARSTYPLVVTGHGFGGALATLATAEIRNLDAQTLGLNTTTTTTLYTYGSPRVGDAATASWVTAQGSNFRLTHTDDPVPKLGSRASGLAHYAPEYWNQADNTDFSVGAYQFATFGQVEDQRGNLGHQGPDALDAAAHIEYFMCNIGSCHGAYNQSRCDSFLEVENGQLVYVTG